MKLTQAFVKRATCKEGIKKQEFYDDDLKGFILEVRNNGRKTFFLRFTDSQTKKTSYTKIADATVLPLDEAKGKAIKLKRSIEEGKDVVLTSPEPSIKAFTLSQFYHEHYLPFIQSHIKSWRCNDSTFRIHILPALGHHIMQDITKSDILKSHHALLRSKRLKPSSSNKFLTFLNHAFNIAMDLESKGITSNPLQNIKGVKVNNEKERYLSPFETQALMDAVRTSHNPHLKHIIPFLILTGARKNECLKAKWKEFDRIKGLWVIPQENSKNKKKRYIPLSLELQDLLDHIPKTSPYLFPSPITHKPYANIYHAWFYARNKAGLNDVRLHDLRHTFASTLINNGRSLYEVQQLLGHSTPRMTQRYAHLSNNTLLEAISCAGKVLG